MRLIELRLKNLNSLKGEWHIDFSHPAFLNEGIFAIIGQTGAGKTTILDAICLALYSQTPRLGDITASTNEIMTQGTGECSAEVIIEINAKRYQCSWYQHRAHKKAKGNLLPIKHEISEVKTGNILEEKKSKTAAYIQALIGMDFNQFTRSIMLAQGSFAAFLKSDIGNRAAILEKITGTAIYANISLKAHEKKRFEEEILGKLQAGINSLSLLSLEDEKRLAAEFETLNQQQSKQRQTFKTLSEQLQWLDNVQQLQQNLIIYQADFIAAKQNQQIFAPSAQRLEIANNALDIDSPFLELSHSRELVKRLDTEKQNLLSKIPTQQQAFVQASTDFHDVNILEKQATDTLKTTLPVIVKTRELDIEIKQQSHSLVNDNKNRDILVTKIQKLRQDITNHKQIAQETKVQLGSLDQYFKDYQALNELDTDMANFDSSYLYLKKLLEEKEALLAQKTSQNNTSSQLQSSFDRLAQQQDANDEIMKQQHEQLISLQQQQSVLVKRQSIASMRHEQEQIGQMNNQIEYTKSKLHKLSELANQIHDINLSLPTLNKHLTALERFITKQQSATWDIKHKRQNQQTHLNLLQKVASLEHYIAELEDGAPCPLCGAHEHPYRTNHPLKNNSNEQNPLSQTEQQITELDTLIETLEQDLSKSRIEQATQQQTFSNQQQQLAHLQQQAKVLDSDIQTDISSIVDTKDSHSSWIMVKIKPLAQISEDIKTIITPANITHAKAVLCLLDTTKHHLLEYKLSLKNKLTEYDDLTENIFKLSTAIDTDEKQQQALSHDMNNLTTDIKLNIQKMNAIMDNINANGAKLAAIMSSIASLISKYPIDKYKAHLTTDFKTGDVQEALQQLNNCIHKQVVVESADIDIEELGQQRILFNQLKYYFNEQKHNQQQIINTLSGLTVHIESKQAQLNHDDPTLNALEQLMANKAHAIEQLQQNRKEIFADKNTDNEEHKLRGAVDDAKTKLTCTQRQLDAIQHTLHQLQMQAQQLETQIRSATLTMNHQQRTFAALLSASQFKDESAFVSARLPKEAREALNKRKLVIDNALQQAKIPLDSTQQALAQKRAIPMTDESRDILAGKHHQIQMDIDRLNQQLGAINQKMTDNNSQKGQQLAQLMAVEEQKQKLQVWQQLNVLIGSHDGKKYRTFAQGLTFEVMIGHANMQLQKMSDRYLLIHDDNNPLELNVIDNYQGGDIRSTKNLSGGEGFIISLALALGLSQMSSHNIRVDSLFLDEGFGTLDEESLDIALDTLTNLQQEGKLIGIISHVQALKDRILTQIKVEKISGGFSQISGKGCCQIIPEKLS